MPLLLGILFGLIAYSAACWAAIVFVVIPSFPYLVVGGALLGVLLAVAVLVGTLLRLGSLGATPVTPVDVGKRLPKPSGEFERDSAWPNYLFAQSRDDLGRAIDLTSTAVSRMWRSMSRPVRDEPAWLFGWPLLLLPLVGGSMLTFGVFAAILVVYPLMVVVLGTAWLGWFVVVGVLRGADAGIRTVRGVRGTCDDCGYRDHLPAFRCRCGQVHRDIRAGRLGAFTRRCECGTHLPTTVTGAAASHVAQCQDCDEPLRAGTGAHTDVVVPVFGPASAGKTRLVYAGMVALAAHLRAVGGTLRPSGVSDETVYTMAEAIIGSAGPTAKTAASAPRVGIVVRLGHARRRALLHLFDAAGEVLGDREQVRELRYLDDPEGYLFVLDPLSIPSVVDESVGRHVADVATEHPQAAYTVMAKALVDQGVKLDRKPLAVAVVKSDVLLGLPVATPLDTQSESAEIELWLRERGLGNLVTGASRDFAAVRYFLVSSLKSGAQPDGTAGPTSAAQPLLWLLSRSRMPIPARALAGAR